MGHKGGVSLKFTYIYHSCFLTETERCYYLFDYYKGNGDAEDICSFIL